jgi:dTDP-4-amino-4,6-dideoxygalactose transaminase
MVPLCDLTEQYRRLKPEIDAAVQEVMASGHYILGSNVKAFEREIADYLGCRHAVGVGSGTDALHLALRALDIGPGDEVITTPFTFIATTEAIGIVGATPVFVDVDPHTYNIDPDLIESAITGRTKAILPVHLYGQPCDMDAIMAIASRHRLHVVEDCAQAMGARYRGRRVGTCGVVGCFSFFPSKNLGCYGDGGMVATNDEQLYDRIAMLRRHGCRRKYFHEELGLNSRLDELHAAVLRIKLRHLDDWNQRRRERAYRYNALLAELSEIQRPAEIDAGLAVVPTTPNAVGDLVEAVYHQYTVQLDNRDLVQAALGRADVGCAIYYPVPLHLQRVHEPLQLRPGTLPVAEQVSRRCLSLPMFPELTDEEQRQVVCSLDSAIHRAANRCCAA